MKIIYCIVGRNEIVKMKEMIHRIDPQAFITITEAHEILGEGFTYIKEVSKKLGSSSFFFIQKV